MATTSKLRRILVIDDHPLVLSGFAFVLAADPSLKMISAVDEKSGFQVFSSQKPDVTVIDINLPDLSGFELLRRIRKHDPEAAVVMLSMNEEPAFVIRSLELGARGYISKADDPRSILKAIHAVTKGSTFIPAHLAQAVTLAAANIRTNPAAYLTTREQETLRLLGRGNKLGEAASTLGVSYKTVANTAAILKRKLNAKGLAELVRFAIEMKLG